MNHKSVLLSGLIAGLVINIGETILNIPIVGKDFEAAMVNLGLSGVMPGATIAVFVVLCFLLGIMSMWLYAAVRPYMGPGPKTAVIIGIVVWMLAFGFPNVGIAAMGVFPKKLVLMAVLWEMIELPLAVLAGAYFYKEDPSKARTPNHATA